jgi:lipopolysaccharide biosynthesis glycosyltransferase
MKTCMFTTLNQNFMIAFKPFMRSFLKHNQWFNLKFFILDLDLDEVDRKECLKEYDKIEFIKPKYDNYKNVNFYVTADKLKSTYYKLDAFSLYNYRVISIDLDMIITGSMKEVFNCDSEFAACRSYRINEDRLGDDINSGLFVANNLTEKKYNCLLKIAERGHKMPDQATINIYHKGVEIQHLPKKYNCEKRMWISENEEIKDIIKDYVVVHYVGQKPWELIKRDHESKYENLEKIWWEYFNG